MASNEEGVSEKKIKARIAFLASSVDAFLQDFTDKANSNDSLGVIVAAARLAQLGTSIGEEFHSISSQLCNSETEAKAANQACVLVLKMVNDNAEQLGLFKCAAERKAELDSGSADKSLN
jgi:hypothetical protein